MPWLKVEKKNPKASLIADSFPEMSGVSSIAYVIPEIFQLLRHFGVNAWFPPLPATYVRKVNTNCKVKPLCHNIFENWPHLYNKYLIK